MYEVFLNFRGSDTRQHLVDTLYHCMKKLQIRVFLDSEDLHMGDRIEELFQRIKECKIYITIFSEKYATSHWCLDELARMKLEKSRNEDKRILPIFYKVTPANVKLREEGGYKKDLEDLAEKHGVENQKVETWMDALKYVGGISGKSLENQGMMSFSQSIAHEILSMLNQKTVPHYLIEMRDEVKGVVDLLEIESGDVRFLVIHGKSGIGKTALAKLVFDQLSSRFQGCSFLEDIGGALKDYENLESQMLRDIPVAGADRWTEAMYRDMKVLLVFDDVDEWGQIQKFAGKSISFGSGSRIIITSIYKSILPIQQKPVEDNLEQFKEVSIVKKRDMGHEKALELFCWHAFGRNSPPTDAYMILSVEAVNCIGTPPLALEILGSYLHRKSKDVWESALLELKNDVDAESIFHRMLNIIYDSLPDKVRMIFLDIACFFVNKEKTNAVYMWKACLTDGIEVLRNLSLVKIVDDNKLWMHSQLRDFGREKVRLESTNYLERSRFWEHKRALEVLESEKAKKNAQVICLSSDRSLPSYCFKREQFTGLQKLRFLQLYRTEFGGDLKGLLKDLKWLSWHQCPGYFRAINFCMWSLTILDLSGSSIEDTWEGWQQMRGLKLLKVLNLTGCQCLTRTPEFSGFPALERLILKDCKSLSAIDSSIGNLRSLKYVNVEGCDSLTTFPDEICDLTTLTEIVIGKESKGSFELPERIGSLESLVTLEINNVRLARFPGTIGGLKKLCRLSLSGCSGLKRLPDSIGDLVSLTVLDISNSKFIRFPDSMGELTKLEVIKMGSSRVTTLPSTIGSLKKLEKLYAQHSKLKGEIPSQIGGLSSLKILDLSSTKISGLPCQINQLTKLERLSLESCDNISRLPSLPTSLHSLSVISKSLQSAGDLSSLKNMTDLVMIGDTHGVASNEEQSSNYRWIESLTQLENLELGLSNIIAPSARFSDFSSLKSLKLCCQRINHIPLLPPSLLALSLRHCKVLLNLSNLKNLSILRLYKCRVEELGVLGLGNLVDFFAEDCTFSMPVGSLLPRTLRIFYLCGSDIQENVLDLSKFKNLRQLELWDCKDLLEIRGLEELECMEELIISKCDSIASLKGLSAWKKVEVIELCDCENLKDIEDLERLKYVRRFWILGCKSVIARNNEHGRDEVSCLRRVRRRLQ